MKMTAIFDSRPCDLGEGPLWHPERKQLFWFDILGKRLLTQNGHGPQEWHFAECVSAAGWIDRDTLLIASETALFRFNLETGAKREIVALEADQPDTRSNDGRADPFGGFWIGTMGKQAETGAGAIYRYYRGQLRCLYPGMSIPNSMCFPAHGRFAQFSDSATGQVMRVAVDADGWPKGEPELFLDLSGRDYVPDGAVIDTAGTLWMAEWGAARVSSYAPDGTYLKSIAFDAPHTSCAAFGGPDLTTLFCTSALEDMDADARVAYPKAGMTFSAPHVSIGQPENRVIL
jgi:sugar lactone lactonase YvrE